MILSQTVVLPLAVPPATPIKKGLLFIPLKELHVEEWAKTPLGDDLNGEPFRLALGLLLKLFACSIVDDNDDDVVALLPRNGTE